MAFHAVVLACLMQTYECFEMLDMQGPYTKLRDCQKRLDEMALKISHKGFVIERKSCFIVKDKQNGTSL